MCVHTYVGKLLITLSDLIKEVIKFSDDTMDLTDIM